jgi:hypothetical protein
MTLDVSSALPYGPLEAHEVYFEHDGPRIFALRSRRFLVYLLAICVDEDEESEEVRFLYLAMSRDRFMQVRSGQVSFLEAFEAASHGDIWIVTEDYSAQPTVRANVVGFADIAPDDLPLPLARLNLQTPTVQAFDPSELEVLARETLRSIAAIELDADGENLTEFPLRALGKVGTTLQEAIDALAQEERGEPTERGAIKRETTEEVQMSVVGLRAASFVLLVGTDKRGRFLERGDFVAETLGRLVELVQAGEDEGKLVTAMRGYGPRARGKFTTLLRAVAEAGSGLGVHVAPVERPVRSALLDVRQVRRALSIIEGVRPDIEELHLDRVILTALNTTRATFEVWDSVSGARYSGRVTSEAREMVEGLRVGHSSYVQVDLEIEIDFAAIGDEDSIRKYFLKRISPLD